MRAATRRRHQVPDRCGAIALLLLLTAAAVLASAAAAADASLPVHKYSTRVVRTKYGPLRGVLLHGRRPVEAFLGVPYATPPLGSLRYMPPVTPSMWRATRLADRFGAVCPQRPPDIGNRTEALLELPRGRLLHLEKLLPLLANQSEDCLYLNLYVPRAGNGPEGANAAMPCILYIHGESYEWNSGNPYDGTMLAAYGHVIVVTINFRLGILGFLKTGAKASAQGNFGLMDLVAGLHWLRENLPAFGGDPERITLMGHGTGAALANFIAVSPVAKELLHRVVLLSGSGLSPWALQREPLAMKRRVAEKTDCHGDLLEDDIAPCLRSRPLRQLLSVQADVPRFLPGFAPFVDGTVLLPSNPNTMSQQSSSSTITSTVINAAGFELADFIDRDLLFGLTSTESYLDLSAQDLEFGFNETRRDRILRTYVRNSYYYHLNEIFSTLKNEYTDWERPIQNPLSVRDATLEVLSDGHTAAPLIRVGYLHALRGGRTFFLHFAHQSGERDFPQRTGSVRGEDVPYVLGLPLVGGVPFFPHNYSKTDAAVSRLLIQYLANFARKGDPNGGSNTEGGSSMSEVKPYSGDLANSKHQQISLTDQFDSIETDIKSPPFWDTYDTINQLYMAMGNKPEMKSHYRGHKMSLWLNLIPQLHRPGDADDLSMRHHHFLEEGSQFYDGLVRPQTNQRPSNQGHILAAPPPPPTTARPTTRNISTLPMSNSETTLQTTMTTECPPNSTINQIAPQLKTGQSTTNNNLLRKLASNHYQSYTTALTVTITVGCFLLLLNILIFAGIYHQRDRGKQRFGDKKKEDLTEAGSGSSSSGEAYENKIIHYDVHAVNYDSCKSPNFERSGSNYECGKLPPKFIGDFSSSFDHENNSSSFQKRALVDISGSVVELQEFKCSPPSGVKRTENNEHIAPPSYAENKNTCSNIDGCNDSEKNHNCSDDLISPCIPEPPPPPKQTAPSGASVMNQVGGGILRTQSGTATPGAMKKRVQIQEISV